MELLELKGFKSRHGPPPKSRPPRNHVSRAIPELLALLSGSKVLVVVTAACCLFGCGSIGLVSNENRYRDPPSDAGFRRPSKATDVCE